MTHAWDVMHCRCDAQAAFAWCRSPQALAPSHAFACPHLESLTYMTGLYMLNIHMTGLCMLTYMTGLCMFNIHMTGLCMLNIHMTGLCMLTYMTGLCMLNIHMTGLCMLNIHDRSLYA